MANDPILQHLYDLLERPENGRSSNKTSPFGGRRKTGSDPHGGFDLNRGRGVGGTVSSPVFGIVGREIGGPLGKIVIHELDPVTKEPTGYDIELLHTRQQHVSEGKLVKPGQVVGEEGSVGAPASHLHTQVYQGADRTPLNPVRHFFEYHYPGQPLPPWSELSPYSVPPKPGGRLDPLKDPALQKGLEDIGQSPSGQADGASAPTNPAQPVQPNRLQSTSSPSDTTKSRRLLRRWISLRRSSAIRRLRMEAVERTCRCQTWDRPSTFTTPRRQSRKAYRFPCPMSQPTRGAMEA